MSTPLKDHRTSIDESTDMWLDIEAAIQKKDKLVISREILREWALAKAHAYNVAKKLIQENNDETAYAGMPRSCDAACPRGGR